MIKLIVTLFVALHVLTTRIVEKATALVAPIGGWVGGVAEAIFRPVVGRLNAVHDRMIEALEDAYKGVNYTAEQLVLGGGAGLLAFWAVVFGGLLLHASGVEQVYVYVDAGCYVVTSQVEGCIVDDVPFNEPLGERVMIMKGYLR